MDLSIHAKGFAQQRGLPNTWNDASIANMHFYWLNGANNNIPKRIVPGANYPLWVPVRIANAGIANGW
jgi:hypothetical protein